MALNPLSFINLADKRLQGFNIISFVDSICTIATTIGAKQRHILHTIISQCFEHNNGSSQPTLLDIFEELKNYYQEHNISPDSLLAIISALASDIFANNSAADEDKFYQQSLYINLPIELSDTLRQLCVFLTLKYLLAELSTANDTEPTVENIKPLRYVIVVDEAHVYLKNKNASKALEEILRVLRSKGVVVIMLTQGVEDYKRSNFDFSSQVKIPICLNIQNKDYGLIESFLGTPSARAKLQRAIGQLQAQKAIITHLTHLNIKLFGKMRNHRNSSLRRAREIE